MEARLDIQGRLATPEGEIWYGVAGSASNRPPVVVIHGGPGATHDYLLPIAALSNSRQVIFYDQLGSGNSDLRVTPEKWTVERFVNELELLADRLELSEYHLLGQSWGTMVAVDYCLSGPRKGLKSMVLSGPCLSVERFASDQRRHVDNLPADIRRTILDCEENGDFESDAYQQAALFFYRKHVCRENPWPDCMLRTLDRLGRNVYEKMWGPSEFTVTGSLKGYDRVADLAKIKIPVLFTCGEFDEAPPRTTCFYRDALPGSEVAIFMGASHEHHLEKTGPYLETVAQFLERAD